MQLQDQHPFTLMIIFTVVVSTLLVLIHYIIKRKHVLMHCTLMMVIFLLAYEVLTPSPDDIKHLIHGDNRSIVYMEDGHIQQAINGDKALPIASVMKVFIAVEYADQVVHHQINPNEHVVYKEVLRYDLPDVEGESEMQRTFESVYGTQHLTLNDVAKGMIRYSANANTDYLIDRLNIDAINNKINALKMGNHERIKPLIGGMVMASQLNSDALQQRIDEDDVYRHVIRAKDLFVTGKISKEKVLKDFDQPRQVYWSDHLTHASAKSYALLMNDINSGKFGVEQTKILRTLLEQTSDQHIQSLYQHYGYKGGSTLKLLNGVYYTTKKNGHTQALAFYLNDLNPWEMYKAQRAFKLFRNKVLEDKAYRESLYEDHSE
ncbi:serine hydrolase [Macrococcus capreoli]